MLYKFQVFCWRKVNDEIKGHNLLIWGVSPHPFRLRIQVISSSPKLVFGGCKSVKRWVFFLFCYVCCCCVCFLLVWCHCNTKLNTKYSLMYSYNFLFFRFKSGFQDNTHQRKSLSTPCDHTVAMGDLLASIWATGTIKVLSTYSIL